MRNLFMLTTISVVLLMVSCKTGNKSQVTDKTVSTETVINDVSWKGVYAGILPCADCPGIETVVDLKEDGSFFLQAIYQEKSDDVFESKGFIEWNEDVMILKIEEGSIFPVNYLVENNALIQLDIDGNRITGDLAENYVLKKIDKNLVEKYWKLTELNGESVIRDESSIREPHIILKTFGNTINGNSGCNNFFGTYQLDSGDKIKFSQMAATKMYCFNMEIETQLFEVFEMADNYAVNDEKELILYNAEMKEIARFEVVWLR